MPSNASIDDISLYIKKNLRKGYTRESLKWALVDQGYSKMEIERAFKKAERELADEAPILKTKPVIEHKVIDVEEPKKSFWRKLFS